MAEDAKLKEVKIILQEIFDLDCSEENVKTSLALTMALSGLVFQTGETNPQVVKMYQHFFDLIALKPAEVSQPAWMVLTLISSYNEGSSIIQQVFASASDKKLEIVFCSIIRALSLYTDKYEGNLGITLAFWAAGLMEFLEKEKNYYVILNVAQYAIRPLLRTLTDFNLIKWPWVIDFVKTFFQNGLAFCTFQILDRKDICDVMENFKGDASHKIVFLECAYQMFHRMVVSCPDFFESETRNNLKREVRNFIKPSYFYKDFKKSSIENILKCYQCFNHHARELFTCKDGHPVCDQCKKIFKCCSVCLGKITKHSNPILNKIVDTVRFPCKYTNYGCEGRFFNVEIIQHEEKCYYSTQICDLILDHLDGESERKCFQVVVKQDFKKHAEKCHKQLIFDFNMEVKMKTEIKWDEKVRVRLLKDKETGNLFMERTVIQNSLKDDDKVFLLSYYFIGSMNDLPISNSYSYYLEFDGCNAQNKLSFSNLCYSYFLEDGEYREKLFFKSQAKDSCFLNFGRVDYYTFMIKNLEMEGDDSDIQVLN